MIVGGEGDEAPGTRAQVTWEGRGALTLEASCELSANSRADFGRVPAGRYWLSLSRDSGSTQRLAREVEAGGEFEFLFPSAR